MENLVQIGSVAKRGEAARRPPWLKVKVRSNDRFLELKKLMRGLKLNTVCEEARCPNIWECWGEHKTATFMIMGEICTRACRYCSVTSARPEALEPYEPENIAEAVEQLNLSHAVITSVDRDDLEDFGSRHFAATIRAVKERMPECQVEVLIPDFMGDPLALERVLDTRPAVLNHNTETVPALFKKMRSKGSYTRTMNLLERVHAYRSRTGISMTTKSGVMVGLGESIDELLSVMDDLRDVHCDVLTLGQYLNPTTKHAPIARFYTPDEFVMLKEEALTRGFKHVESGPLVRSSYHAHEHVPTA